MSRYDDPVPLPPADHIAHRATAECGIGFCSAYEDRQHCTCWRDGEPCHGCGCDHGDRAYGKGVRE